LTILPAFLEIFRRRDRAISEQTSYQERLELVPLLERVGSKARAKMTGGVIRRRSENAVIEGEVCAEGLPSETLEHLLREAEELLGEDDG